MNPLQLLKKAPWRKIALGLVFLLVLLVTLIVLTGAWSSYQGRREWAETKAELLKRGEVLSYEGLVPAPVPPEQNFFADPIWEPDQDGQISLFDPQIGTEEAACLKERFPGMSALVKVGPRREVAQNVGRQAKDRSMTPEEAALVLTVLQPVRRTFDALRWLGLRPEATFPLDYSQGIAVKLPHVHALFEAGLMLHRSAQAEAALGQRDRSVDDILLMLRLSRTLNDEPVLISFLVGISLDSLALDVVEKQVPTWNAEQAQRVQQALSQSELLKQTAKAFRGERAFGNQLIDQLKRASISELVKTFQLVVGVSDSENKPLSLAAFPIGAYRIAFLDGDRAYLNKTHQRWLDLLEKQPGLLRPHDFENLNTDFSREMDGVNRYRYILTYLAMPAFRNVFSKAASIETGLRQARIACAIQECALSEKALPSSLDQLVPKYLDEIPRDVINGGPMRYRSDGKEYVLWSVGWNEKDDGGESSPLEKIRWKKLDWVWKGRLPDAVATP